MLVKYIKARESYDHNFYQHDYQTVVRLLSDIWVYKRFQKFLAYDKRSSPIHTLGRNGRRGVEIKSIVFLKPKIAQIRVDLSQYTMPSSALEWTEHYLITLEFDFLGLDLTEHDRYINPLGFKVISYRKDRETL